MILMLVEDHFRLQSKQNSAANAIDVSPSPLSLVYPLNNRSRTLATVGESSEVSSSRASVSSDSGGVHLDVSGNTLNHILMFCYFASLILLLLCMFSSVEDA